MLFFLLVDNEPNQAQATNNPALKVYAVHCSENRCDIDVACMHAGVYPAGVGGQLGRMGAKRGSRIITNA